MRALLRLVSIVVVLNESTLAAQAASGGGYMREGEKRLLTWLIFLSIPAALAAIGAFLKLLFQGKHPLVGKPSEITQFHDKDGNPVPLQGFKDRITVVQAWPDTQTLLSVLARRDKHANVFRNSKVAYLLVYVGDNPAKAIEEIREHKLDIPSPFLVDKDNDFRKRFGDKYWVGALIIDDQGIVRSVPRDSWTHDDHTTVANLLEKRG